MADTLTAHTGLGNLNAASVADNALISDLLVFTTMTLPVLAGPEDSFTVQAVLFRL